MDAVKKPSSIDPFLFSNEIYLRDWLPLSTYSYGDNYSSSAPNLLIDITGIRSDTGWLINAGNGKDLIDASMSTENNRLSGGNGKDTILGGMGNDHIDGGNGDDELTGNGGADVFVMSGGNDVIHDFSPAASAVLTRSISFENLNLSRNEFESLSEFEGLYWTNVSATLASNFSPDTGLMNVASGSVVGMSNGSDYMSISSLPSDPDSLLDFDFVAGDFAPFVNATSIEFVAYDDTIEVGTLSFHAPNPGKLHVDFELGIVTDAGGNSVSADFWGTFKSIDQIVINLGEEAIAMDNLLFAYSLDVGAGDKIDLDDGVDVAAYMASAMDDGAGNTVLTDDNNSLTLVGVSASAVSVDWFV
jgi:hypothetical protein